MDNVKQEFKSEMDNFSFGHDNRQEFPVKSEVKSELKTENVFDF